MNHILYYSVFVVSFIVYVSGSEPSRSIVSTVGEQAQICCEHDTADYVQWSFRPVRASQREEIHIRFDSMASKYQSKLDQTGRIKQWILIINNIQLSDAGTYTCDLQTTLKDGSFDSVKYKTNLTVKEVSNPECETNLNSVLLEGDHIYIRCSFVCYAERIPVLEWSKFKHGHPISNGVSTHTRTNNRISFSVTDVVGATDNGSSYSWKIFDRGDSRVFNFTWKSEQINVLYGPRNVSIISPGRNLSPGDNLTCSADSNPSSSFRWTDTDTGTVIGEGPVLPIVESMARETVYSYQCIASNYVNSSLKTKASDLFVFVVRIKSPSYAGLFSYMSLALLVVGVIVIFACVAKLIAWIHRKCKTKLSVQVVEKKDNRYEKQYVSLKPALQTLEQTNPESSNASSTPELPPRASTYDEIEFEAKVKERYLNSDSSSSNASEYEPLSNVKDNISPPRGTEYMKTEVGVGETLRTPDSIQLKGEMKCHDSQSNKAYAPLHVMKTVEQDVDLEYIPFNEMGKFWLPV